MTRGVYIYSNYAYVADGVSGLRIIDVSDPISPKEVGFYDTGGFAYDVYISDNYAYVADGGGGLRVIDVSNPAAPDEVGFFEDKARIFAYSVYILNNYAYVASGTPGIYIFRNDLITDITEEKYQLPSTFTLKQNYPNPFNPTTTIKYTLPKAFHVELSIYNTLGQKVRTLVKKQQFAGHYQVQWDGRDDKGKPVGSGMYLYRLQSGDYVEIKKMILLK